MKARIDVVVTLTVAALVLAACGSSSSSTTTPNFRQGYLKVRSQFNQTTQGIGSEVRQAGSQTDLQASSRFHDLAAEWQTGLTQLQALTPPADVASNYNTLNRSATRVENDLNAVSTALGNHDKAGTQGSFMSLLRDLGTSEAASRAIDATLGIK